MEERRYFNTYTHGLTQLVINADESKSKSICKSWPNYGGLAGRRKRFGERAIARLRESDEKRSELSNERAVVNECTPTSEARAVNRDRKEKEERKGAKCG